MAKVFTGKRVTILTPETLDAMEKEAIEFDEAKAPLREQMNKLTGEFEKYLIKKQYNKKIVNECRMIISIFGDFLYLYTDVLKVEEVTKGMANSYFRRWYNGKVLNAKRSDFELKSTMYLFFNFLADEKGMRNEAVLKSFDSSSRKAKRINVRF